MKVVRTDKTSAQDDVSYIIDSKAGKVSGTTQRELVDETTNETVPDGDPSDLGFTADEQAAIIKGSDGVVAAVLAARVPATPAQTVTPQS